MVIEFLQKCVDILAGLLVSTASVKYWERLATTCFSTVPIKCE